MEAQINTKEIIEKLEKLQIQVNRLQEDFEDPEVIILVLKDQAGRVVGYLDAESYEDGEVNVDSMAVHPDFRGRGFSKKLMDQLLKIAEERGFWFVTGDYAIQNGLADSLQRHYGAKIIEWNDHDSEYGPQRFLKIKIQ